MFKNLLISTIQLVLKKYLIPFVLLFSISAQVHSVQNGLIAIFLYNFSNYIEWPASAFQRNANLEICLLGKVDFVDTMRNFEGTPIRGHPLRVVATQDEKMVLGGCHILYVGIDRRDDMQKFLKNLNHMFVLSVGESSNFISDGGTINIARTADQAQFSIDLSKAIKNGLSVSSDLLELATEINEN